MTESGLRYVLPEYSSTQEPDRMVQCRPRVTCVPAPISVSSRASQPFRSGSSQCGNRLELYPLSDDAVTV